jgi:hypothetical protein
MDEEEISKNSGQPTRGKKNENEPKRFGAK